jgi:hypothetical protein
MATNTVLSTHSVQGAEDEAGGIKMFRSYQASCCLIQNQAQIVVCIDQLVSFQ